MQTTGIITESVHPIRNKCGGNKGRVLLAPNAFGLPCHRHDCIHSASAGHPKNHMLTTTLLIVLIVAVFGHGLYGHVQQRRLLLAHDALHRAMRTYLAGLLAEDEAEATVRIKDAIDQLRT